MIAAFFTSDMDNEMTDNVARKLQGVVGESVFGGSDSARKEKTDECVETV